MIKFTGKEVRDLIISFIVITIATETMDSS